MQCNVSRYVGRHAHVTTYIFIDLHLYSLCTLISVFYVCKENNRNLSVVHSPAFSKKATANLHRVTDSLAQLRAQKH